MKHIEFLQLYREDAVVAVARGAAARGAAADSGVTAQSSGLSARGGAGWGRSPFGFSPLIFIAMMSFQWRPRKQFWFFRIAAFDPVEWKCSLVEADLNQPGTLGWSQRSAFQICIKCFFNASILVLMLDTGDGEVTFMSYNVHVKRAVIFCISMKIIRSFSCKNTHASCPSQHLWFVPGPACWEPLLGPDSALICPRMLSVPPVIIAQKLRTLSLRVSLSLRLWGWLERLKKKGRVKWTVQPDFIPCRCLSGLDF